jgi:hypothetical protein
MYRISLVKDLVEITKNQDIIIEYLIKVIDKAPEVTLKTVLESIGKGHSQLWLVYKDEEILGAVVTKHVSYPVKERLLIHLCGGKAITEWVDLYMETVEEWAKEKGLDGVEIFGRKGWTKLIPDYSSDIIYMVKEF